jgi:hypothetical protein
MDYRQGEVAGTKWHRFSQVSIRNPYQGFPEVTCQEQEVMVFGAQTVVREVGGLDFKFDPAAEFPLLDPVTNEPTGETVTGAQVHALVYSYVLAEAKKRDERFAAPLQTMP